MVAAVNMIYICPKCETPMSSQSKPKKCLGCNFKFVDENSKLSTEFEWPKPPSRQLFEMIQQEVDISIPKETREILPDLPKDQADAVILSIKQKQDVIGRRLEAKYDEFFFNTDYDDVEELVQCIHSLMNRSISSGNRELIKKCAVWAREFSKINDYLKPFLENGGDTYARRDKSTKSGDSK